VGAGGVSTLTATPNDPANPGLPPHPAFATRAGQRVHSDGTLQHIGEVKTSLLACRSPASYGGESILFNSTAAFAALATRDEPAAAALMGEAVLVRTANINDGDSMAGPAFALHGDQLLSRYSVTATDTFQAAGVDPAALNRGLIFLLHHAHPGSPHYLELALSAGQGLLLANDRISHGRRPFRDGTTPRVMLRALFTRALAPAPPEAAGTPQRTGAAGTDNARM
jgi:Taurine catabolism dioxygenase TauD, TfdA family